MNRKRTKWLLAVLMAVVLLGSACSSDSSSDDSSAADSSSDDSSGDDSSGDDSSGDDSSGDDSSGDTDGDEVELTQSGDSILDEIIERGELRIGMTLQFEPQAYLDAAGDPAGYDPQLGQMLADDLGVELKIENHEFDALIPGLLAGQWDMISLGLVPRPARALQMYFTDSYIPYDQVLVAGVDSTIDPSISGYNTEGVTIAALQGATAASQVETQFPNATLAEFPQQDAAFLDVATGRSDALVVESYLAERFIQANPGDVAVVPLGAPLQIEFGALAIPYGDDQFVQFLDTWLQFNKNNGTMDALYDEIFGADPEVSIWPRQ